MSARLAIGPHALMPSRLPRCAGCYLICFDEPYTSPNGAKTVRHYLGWASNIRERIADHHTGNGARLMSVIADAGISWIVTHLWLDATRSDERRLKNQHKHANVCPRCNAALRRGARRGEYRWQPNLPSME